MVLSAVQGVIPGKFEIVVDISNHIFQRTFPHYPKILALFTLIVYNNDIGGVYEHRKRNGDTYFPR